MLWAHKPVDAFSTFATLMAQKGRPLQGLISVLRALGRGGKPRGHDPSIRQQGDTRPVVVARSVRRIFVIGARVPEDDGPVGDGDVRSINGMQRRERS